MEENLAGTSPLTSYRNTAKGVQAQESLRFENLSMLLVRFISQLKKTGKSSNTISAYKNDLFRDQKMKKRADAHLGAAQTCLRLSAIFF